ncbi:membrane protein [Litchfieldella anticariensis FP35 = DSM 16096]|uniref:Transport permease protein n=1 Tax=Litchfieldella anticariensis (strain DSM 16096 / CECT 5854 / CIP 108499 / LMG 22089 / FP35) TaxID=1121939 RepID=S2KKN2_LITA3|nr:ABC transporter permease [Halomonas anticariensis]EPC02500.1 membrane protein [Halomonas anticariensis FP35 = DSM 16096]
MDPKQIATALWTLVVKEIKRFTRIWPQTLLPPSITMTMYFIIFGNLIGSRIGEMDGYTYMDFIVPGLIMMAVITNSYSNVASSFFSNKFQRSVEEMMVSPMPNWVILTGFLLGGMARGLGVGVIVTFVSLFFSRLEVVHPLLTIGVVVLTAGLFSIGGFINALLADKFDDISIVPTFVLTPLTYLGGVFYSISLLPDFWQGVSMLNPILYMVNVFRYGFLGVSDIPVELALAAILAFIVVLFGVALWMLERGQGIRS